MELLLLILFIVLIMGCFSKDEKATQSAWQWLKRIVVAYVVLISLTTLLPQLQNFKLGGE